MTRHPNICLLFTLLIASCLLSCTDQEADMLSGPAEKTVFTLLIPCEDPFDANTPISTRANWGDNYTHSEDGTDFDNAIFTVKAQLYIPNQNTLSLDFNNIVKEERNGREVYVCKAESYTPYSSATGVKLMVWVNTPIINHAYPDQTTFNSLAVYSNGIPMWGVKSGLSLDADNPAQNLGDVWVLRSVARIDIDLAVNLKSNEDSTTGYKLVSATLTGPNVLGFVAPKNYNTIDNTKMLTVPANNTQVGADASQTYNPYPSIPSSAVGFKLINDSHLRLYVAEKTNRSTPVVITIKNNQTGIISSYYNHIQDGEQDPLDIMTPLVRNHIYRYTINSITGEGLKGELTYYVCPWNNKLADIPAFE